MLDMTNRKFVFLDGNKDYPVKIVDYAAQEKDKRPEKLYYLTEDFKWSKKPEAGRNYLKAEIKSISKAAVLASVFAVMAAYSMFSGLSVDDPTIFETIKNGSLDGYILNTIKAIGGLLWSDLTLDSIARICMCKTGLSTIDEYQKDKISKSNLKESDKEQDYDLKEKDAKYESNVFGSMDHSDYDNNYLFEDFGSHKIDKELDYDLNKKDAELTELKNKELETRQQMQAAKSLRDDYLSKDDKSKSEE